MRIFSKKYHIEFVFLSFFIYICINKDIYCRITNDYNYMSKTVHLINEVGDRIEVERKDFSK